MATRLTLVALLATAALSACAEFKSFTPPEPKEISRGQPGLISGPSGVFTVWGPEPSPQPAPGGRVTP